MSAGPRKVYLRWLADSRKFNEWMNPVDYETEEYQKEQDALEQNQTTSSRSRQGDGIEASGNKRKFSPGGDGGTKRAARQRIDPGKTALTPVPDCCTCFYISCLKPFRYLYFAIAISGFTAASVHGNVTVIHKATSSARSPQALTLPYCQHEVVADFEQPSMAVACLLAPCS